MNNRHTKNTVRYYILFTILLAFLFLSNDFGLIDVQKTAIVLAVGIDREEDDFILTSQIAVPQSSTQGKATQAVQLVSKGKTIGQAFEEINAKTGWYPKLVFCRLILLGVSTTEYDVFDALDYFVRDEYLSDNCLVATCDEDAQSLLNTQALVDPASSVAITKVLSEHAERVGTVLPTTLREFSIGYFGESKSGFLPILKTTPQQERKDRKPNEQDREENKDQSSENSVQNNQKNTPEQNQTKPVFSAKRTALFVGGKRVDTLTEEETFAVSALLNKLKLASYSVTDEKGSCALSVRKNSPKIKFQVNKDGNASLQIRLTRTVGALDYSNAQPADKIADVGDIPNGIFPLAEKKLTAEISTAFEKCKACGCDIFRLRERLIKYKNRRLQKYSQTLLQNTVAQVSVRLENVR